MLERPTNPDQSDRAAFWRGFRDGLRQALPFYAVGCLLIAVAFDEPLAVVAGLIAGAIWVVSPQEGPYDEESR